MPPRNLRELGAEWATCARCPLHERRSCVIVGAAVKNAPTVDDPLLLVIGEAPGSEEDAEGVPFAGKAARVLHDEIFAGAGVRLAYVSNCVGCRPPGNRTPARAEIEACAPRVAALIELTAPDAIVVVGPVAEEALASGVWGEGASTLPSCAILHPATLLHRGHPTDATRRALRAEVAKISRLLVRLGAKRPAKAEPVPEVAEVVAPECAHVGVPLGRLVARDGREAPLVVCRECGVALSDPKAAGLTPRRSGRRGDTTSGGARSKRATIDPRASGDEREGVDDATRNDR